jgi:hypothetical protein
MPVALSRVEIAGHNAGAALARLVFPPAHARKNATATRPFPADVRRATGGLPFPAFPPLPPASAFQPSPSIGLPVVRGLPDWRPSPGIEGRGPGFSAPTPGIVVPPPIVRQLPRAAPPGPRGPEGGHRVARLPELEAVRTGWRAVVQPGEAKPGIVRPTLPEPVTRPPPRAGLQPVDTPRPTYRGLLEKLSGRQPRAGIKVAERPPGTKAPEPRKAIPIAPRTRRLGGRPFLGEMLPSVGSFRSNEVLAINLSAEDLGKAREGRYELVERIDLPELGLTISRLRTPETLNAIAGRDRLFDLLPEGSFTLNRVYATYRPGAGRASEDAAVAAQAGRGCPSDRCFGGALINWRPQHAACARDVKVGIVDTGFDRTHPAFAGVRYTYREFLPEGGARASAQHGTGVLALLAGNADSGTPGLIPDASYVVANAFFADDSGQPMSDTTQMLRALHWLRQSGVDVVNLSFAGPDDDLLHHAVRELAKAGTVVVAAAGNEGPAAPPSYPAAYEEVIAVTAVDRNLAPYRYASRGAHIDLAAPGVDVWTAIPGRLEGPQTGTSFAVPYVTAVVAVTLADGGPQPAADDASAVKRQTLARLQGSVRALSDEEPDPTFGAGLVQAPAACGSAPVVTASAPAGRGARPWAGTVRRAVDRGPHEALVLGTWVSTVKAAGKGVAH